MTWVTGSVDPGHENTAAAIAVRVRSGALAPVDAVSDALNRIAERDPVLNAFVSVRADEALAEATALATRADLVKLPLAGVPVAVKDKVALVGAPLRDGSAATSVEPSATDHPVVARLRAAGAVPVGLTAVSELCVWGTTDSPGFVTRNPWNTGLSAGGSSGGAAAAVAAGMVPISHGTDCLGSIRIPAAACGLVGLKPGRGLVPSEIGANSMHSMAENGPLTTTVADAALMLSVLAGRPELAEIGDPGRARIAVVLGHPNPMVRTDAHWACGVEETARILDAAGHLTTAAKATQVYSATSVPDLVRWFAGVAADAETLDRAMLQPRTRRHAAVGRAVNRVGLVRPGPVARVERRLRALAEHFDVVVTPALAHPPPAAVEWSRRSWLANAIACMRFAPYNSLWNLVGWPAVTVPVGIHPHTRTPLAVQIAAPPGGETTVLALAAQLEQLQPWPRLARAAPRHPGHGWHDSAILSVQPEH
ncbi:amidase [Rhodococcus koreensis]|uniref:amidase n=1 Tax=Rhodococcus sp. T2V TaxID=3034164 RepID=UPI0023E1EFFD|nr:amidase [Rhodococcus sp. T2V]MDF3310693.1 amidase [Rhodococcus sp. T2V]